MPLIPIYLLKCIGNSPRSENFQEIQNNLYMPLIPMYLLKCIGPSLSEKSEKKREFPRNSK